MKSGDNYCTDNTLFGSQLFIQVFFFFFYFPVLKINYYIFVGLFVEGKGREDIFTIFFKFFNLNFLG